MATPLPKTPESAPPNFYNQVGAMAAGGAGSGQQASTEGNAAGGKTEHDFLEAITKLLKVLDKLEAMKPNGKDVSKYTKAAAEAMKDCMKEVYGDKAQSAAGEGTADDQAGAGAGAAGNTQAAAGAAGAGSETQQPAAA
jgi:hypothetical protein